MTMTVPNFLPRAPALPPGISADIVLDVIKNIAPQLYAQVCDLVSAHYSATMADQYRRALAARLSRRPNP